MLESLRRLVFACVVGLATSAGVTASEPSKERLERLMAQHGAIRQQLAEAFPTSGIELAAVVVDPEKRASASPAGPAAAKPSGGIDVGLVLLAALLGCLVWFMLSLRNIDF